MYDFEIIELDEELRQNRIERGLEKDTVVARTAKTIARKKDVQRLFAEGMSANDISIVTQMPISTVHNMIAEIRKDQAEAREFLMTGEMPSEGGYLGIIQS